MTALVQIFLILLLLNNLALLGAGRMGMLIRLIGLQGVLLAALLALPSGEGPHAEHLLLAGAVLLIKGAGFPLLLFRTYRKIGMEPQSTPRMGYGGAVVAGMAGLALSLWLEGRLPLPAGFFPPLLLSAALTTLFSGLIMVVSRIKALSQVIGYMAAENGIFLFGIPLLAEGAVWFELALLLDVFAAVFVMGIAINHIGHTFESIDVRRFCSLRD